MSTLYKCDCCGEVKENASGATGSFVTIVADFLAGPGKITSIMEYDAPQVHKTWDYCLDCAVKASIIAVPEDDQPVKFVEVLPVPTPAGTFSSAK